MFFTSDADVAYNLGFIVSRHQPQNDSGGKQETASSDERIDIGVLYTV